MHACMRVYLWALCMHVYNYGGLGQTVDARRFPTINTTKKADGSAPHIRCNCKASYQITHGIQITRNYE